MTVRSFQLDHSNHINTPTQRRAKERLRHSIKLVAHESCHIDQSFVTSLDKVVTINLHCCQVAASSMDLFGHGKLFSMYSFTTLMYGFYDRVCFVSIHVSEQNRIIIPLIQHVLIQEELGTKPSQSLLISDGHFLGIFLLFEISLNVLEPRFTIRFCLDCQIMCWFIQVVNVNSGWFVSPVDFEHKIEESSIACTYALSMSYLFI